MLQTRKKISAATEGAFAADDDARLLPTNAYAGRGGSFFQHIYETDNHIEAPAGGRFRWILSTCLAAAIGAVAILIVVYGSSDDGDRTGDGLLPALKSLGEGALVPQVALTPKNADGLKWVMPKSDRLQLTTGALSTRYIIHESSKSRRDSREYVRQKPYARIVARLAPVPADKKTEIPAFNPFKLYGSGLPSELGQDPDENAGSGLSRSDVTTKVVELLGGILPEEDGQELDTQEVQDIIERGTSGTENLVEGSGLPLDGVAGAGPAMPAQGTDSWQPKAATADNLNTTDIFKSTEAQDEPSDDLEGGQVLVVKVGPQDTLAKILSRAGAPDWDVNGMIDAGHNIFSENALVPGQEVRITLIPSLSDPSKLEPARYSIFSDGHDHLVTVSRSAAGEFVGSSQPPFDTELQHIVNNDGDDPQNASLYASIYLAGLTQDLPAETISKVLSINAFDTDFRRRVRPGDTLEMFFDMKDDQSVDGPPGELLYTAMSSGDSVYKFYRFRSSDGVVDYYDESGNNSKKFLVRKPVRGDDVRLTSGFGVRFHPLLNSRKMHTGVDWACAPGTPIIAAGNGTIEEVGHKGYYGNYIRVRHANGYQTAYGHMSRFAKVTPGMKVRQGQIIGYVGSTGLSSGPHVHFEVLVNNRFVDPMSIQVPRERKLDGKDLAEFQKERARIEDLMRRAPVMTQNK
ncbi:M23 family metallopeptidase [Hyphomicrobium sp.]|uniref:M23 family metallopeptidase n=1 Tax=Hyphomicrobium sp. TaxID=82 RepID=UPI002D786052|nr:M23 family metallopeptidase [Hyphomicrobium sp.]HET6387714.1 M23 family metallopeptidase [Hyphomicrobium sp.]